MRYNATPCFIVDGFYSSGVIIHHIKKVFLNKFGGHRRQNARPATDSSQRNPDSSDNAAHKLTVLFSWTPLNVTAATKETPLEDESLLISSWSWLIIILTAHGEYWPRWFELTATIWQRNVIDQSLFLHRLSAFLLTTASPHPAVV